MAYELVARPNFTIPGKDVPLRQAGPSAFDQEAVQRARAAAEARRVPQGVPNAATATQTGIGGGQSLGQNAVVGGAPGQPAGGANPLPAEPVKGSLRGAFKALASPAAGGVLAAGGQAVNEFENLRTGDPTKIAESTARIGGAGAGWLAGAKLGAAAGAMTGPLAPLAVPALGLAGGVAGGLLGPKLTDWAIEGNRRAAFGNDTPVTPPGGLPTAPTAAPAAAPAAAPNPTAASAAAPAKSYFPPAEKPPLSLSASNAEIAAANPNGRVTTRVGSGGIREFSGTNISGPVSYVGPDGKLADFANAPGNMNVVPGMSKELIAQTLARPVDPLRGLSPGARAAYDEQVRYAQGVNAMGAAMAPGRGGAGGGGGAGGDLNAAVKSLRDAGHVVTHSTLRALIGDQTQRRGQDMTEGTTRRGQDMTQQTALRGQDMDLQGRILPKQMEIEQAARMRGLRAQAWDASGVDPMRAASILASQGLDAKDLLEHATSKQGYDGKAEEQTRGIFKNAFDTVGKDGKPINRPDLEAQAYRRLMEMTGGKFNGLNKGERDRLSTQAFAEVQELDQANQNMRGGVAAELGLGAAPTPYSNLPSAAEQSKATLRRPTTIERFNPFDEYTMGADNWVEEMPDGRKYVYGNLPESRIKSRIDSGVKQK